MSKSGADPVVALVMGSTSDIPVLEAAFEVLEEFGVSFEARVLSAHRTPDEASAYARGLAARGVQVLIAAAGWAAHLAGVMAAYTIVPVIGVPIDSSPLNGMDALLATAQMPPGVPVATMAIGKGGARNAALFAIQILALKDARLCEKFAEYKKNMGEEITGKKSEELRKYLAGRVSGKV